jgi:Pyruvate/2-oxoacid:ferredoxin oxidoreductase delta subunit
MKHRARTDPFLTRRVAQYDEWLAQGLISHSARVVPVGESLTPRQWVLPAGQVTDVLRAARSIAVQNCECRTHYRRCDHPREVCLLLNQVGERLVEKGEARAVSLDEAEGILRQADASGLVHLSLYMPDHQVYALCSCCACCCHDLQIVRAFARPDLLVHADYVARTDPTACVDCGACVPRCVFGARAMRAGALVYRPASCAGCGLCVTVCPTGATTMALRAG